jgi:DNA polymerase III epsilon subunit-like protein
MTKIIWTDLETGGLYPEQSDVTQIAAILDVDGEIKGELNIFLRPDPARVSASALAVQKKTLEQVLAHPLSQAEGYGAFRTQLEVWTSDGKASWGGQNAEFDVRFCKALFKANGAEGGLSAYFDGTTVDTRYLADGLRSKGQLRAPNSKLGTICSAVGVPLGDGAHDALNDIRATRAAFYELRKRFPVAA